MLAQVGQRGHPQERYDYGMLAATKVNTLCNRQATGDHRCCDSTYRGGELKFEWSGGGVSEVMFSFPGESP